ncbi:MAG: O-antigen ligase family protein, partial [Bacteroidetes bacterium]
MSLGLGLTKILPVLIYLGGITVIFLTIFYRIEIGIFLLVPLLPQQLLLDRMLVFPMGKDFMDLLLIAIIIKWLLNKNKKDLAFFLKTSFNWPILLLIIWTYLELWRGSFYLGISLPISIRDPRFVIWKNFIVMPIIYLMVLNNIKETKYIKILIILMTLSILAMGLHFRSNFAGTDTSHFRNDMRLVGTFTYLSPNAVGVFFAQYAMMLLGLSLFDNHKYRKILYLVTVGFSLYAVVFIFSRGAYSAVLITWLFIGLIKERKLLVLLVFFILTWKSILPNAVIERVEMTKGDTSVQERFSLWKSAKKLIESNPVIGTGYATLSFLHIRDEITGKTRKSLHSGYLEVASELGIIGLALFVYLYILGFQAGFGLYKKAEDPFIRGLGFGLMACVVAALAGNLAGSYWHYINVSGFYWVTLALVVRSLQSLKEQPETVQESKNELQVSYELPLDRYYLDQLYNDFLEVNNLNEAKLIIISPDKESRKELIDVLTNACYSEKPVKNDPFDSIEFGKIVTWKSKNINI